MKKGDYWKINFHDFERTDYCTQCKKLSILEYRCHTNVSNEVWKKKLPKSWILQLKLQGHSVAHNVKSNLYLNIDAIPVWENWRVEGKWKIPIKMKWIFSCT